jgi:hypothetical protein
MSYVALGVAGVTGIVQIAAAQKKKKEAALEEQASHAPKYTGSNTLEKYYQQSQQLANTAAQNSALYKQNQNQANRNLGAGLAATNVIQGGQGAVAGLVSGANDAAGRNIAGAEAQKERRFGQFGQATQMKAADDWKKFQINEQQPWETKYNLLAAKAAAAAQQQQAGFSNLTNAAIAGARAGTAKSIAKGDKGVKGTGTNDTEILYDRDTDSRV